MDQESAAGAVVYFMEKEPKFLMIKSTYWGFPKGIMEKGEKESETALREVKEETNLTVKLLPDFSYRQEWFYRWEGEMIKKNAVYFLARITPQESKKVKISSEHTEFIWVTYSEAVKLIKIKANTDLLNTAIDYIKEYESQKRLT
jgi:bis(5'-nucleosidyl)-tetraphosphatase